MVIMPAYRHTKRYLHHQPNHHTPSDDIVRMSFQINGPYMTVMPFAVYRLSNGGIIMM